LGQEHLFLENLRRVICSRWLAARLRDGVAHAINISVPFVYERQGEIRYVTRRWSNVERGRTDRQDVIELRRMNDADEGIAHNNNMQVGG
jgi:hypothetical protein